MILPCAKNNYVGIADPTDMDLPKRAIAILDACRYCTLSTVSPDGIPWGSPIFFAADTGINVYWSSSTVSQHSRNLAQSSGQATITMYVAYDKPGQTEGLYFRGHGEAIEDKAQATQILPLMMAKSGRLLTRTASDYLEPSLRRFYQFTPEAVWITGDRLVDGNQLIDTKIALDMAKLKELNSL